MAVMQSRKPWMHGPVAGALLIMTPALILPQSRTDSDACRPVSAEAASLMSRYVQRHYQLEAAPSLSEDDTDIDPQCYRRLVFSGVRSGHQVQVALFLAPDQKHLFPGVFDLTADPAVAKVKEEDRIRKIVIKDAKPIRGLEGAPVEIVLYSDFQCPYCARLWSASSRDIIAEDPKIAIYYRSFPLEKAHPWAHAAAVIGKCAEQQDPQYLISLADFLYREQREITINNISARASGYLETLEGFDGLHLKTCVESGAGDGALAQDVASGLRADVRAVPTIFINGRRVQGVVPPEALKKLIAEAKESYKSK